MSARLAALPYQPQTIDADSLVASTIPPKARQRIATATTIPSANCAAATMSDS